MHTSSCDTSRSMDSISFDHSNLLPLSAPRRARRFTAREATSHPDTAMETDHSPPQLATTSATASRLEIW